MNQYYQEGLSLLSEMKLIKKKQLLTDFVEYFIIHNK